MTMMMINVKDRRAARKE